MTRLACLYSVGALVAVPALAGCPGGGDKEPITIGMSVSLSGPDQEFGETMLAVVNSAVETINDEGGANGHDLVLVYVDDETTEDGAAAAADELVAMGAVAIIGPFNSGPVEAALAALEAGGTQVPIISPSSTAPRLALSTADDGWLFRTAPNDNFQALAMAHYFEDLVTPAVGEIAIVHETGSYGEGLGGALEDEWVDVRNHTLTEATGDSQFAYEPGLDDTTAQALFTELAAATPSAVVMIGLGDDINSLLRVWGAQSPVPAVEWFFSDSAKASSIFGDVGTELPPEADGLKGTAPTSPKTSIAFQTFVDAVANVEGIDVSDQAYTQNTWDAAYLLAAALVQLSADGDDFTGEDIRDALPAVSKEGQTLHAGQWRDLVSRARAGGDIDYDGASGPVDFTTEGETISPYEVWALDIANTTFTQDEYIEVTDL